jgi:hypothetical protein
MFVVSDRLPRVCMDWSQEPWLCEIAENNSKLVHEDVLFEPTVTDAFILVSFAQLQKLFHQYVISAVYVENLDNEEHTAKCWKVYKMSNKM